MKQLLNADATMWGKSILAMKTWETVWIFFFPAATTAQNGPRLKIHVGNKTHLSTNLWAIPGLWSALNWRKFMILDLLCREFDAYCRIQKNGAALQSSLLRKVLYLFNGIKHSEQRGHVESWKQFRLEKCQV